jgi:hypothetical protein
MKEFRILLVTGGFFFFFENQPISHSFIFPIFALYIAGSYK